MIASMVNRIRKCNETGDALVLVVGSVFLVGILVTSLLAVTVNTTAKAQATRAHSQAIAAAEGGIEVLAKNLFKAGASRLACPASGATVTGEVNYTVVKIEYRPAGSSTYTMCNPGSQIPENADAVKIVVEGDAINKGSARNSSGNNAKIERVFERAIVQDLQAAVFTQGNFITNNGGITIPSISGKGDPGDVLTLGKFTCTSGSSVYSGNVYALGGFQQNNPCTIKGDLYIKSSEQVQVSTKLTVEGDLIIDGSVRVSNQAVISGKTLVTGDMNITSNNSQFNGEVFVGGSLTDSNGVTFNNVLTVKGDYNPAYSPSTYNESVYVVGSFGATNPNVLEKMAPSAKLFMAKPMSDMSMGDWAKGQFMANYSGQYEADSSAARNRAIGPDWELPQQFDPEYQEANGYFFPEIGVDDPMFQGWQLMTKEQFAAATGMTISGSICTLDTADTITLRFTAPTKIDLSDCVWKWSWAPKLEIYSDHNVAILVNGIQQGGGGGTQLAFRSITNPALMEVKPKLYVIEPVQESPNVCDPSDSPAHTFQFINFILIQTGWEGSPNANVHSTELVLYSSKNMRIGGLTTPALHAQVYACNLSSYGELKLYFSPEDRESSGLQALTTTSIRDITR